MVRNRRRFGVRPFVQQVLARLLGSDGSATVRGRTVAVDYLLEALGSYSQASLLHLFVPPQMYSGGQFNRRDPSDFPDGPKILFESYGHLLDEGIDRVNPDLWLDLSGITVRAVWLRERLASRVYPIVSVQHAFSIHTFIYDRLLRLLLARTYECDSIVCTSATSKRAMDNLLLAVSHRLRSDFGLDVSFQGRTDVIPLCVNTDLFKPRERIPTRRVLGLATSAMIILYVGYLSPLKADLIPLLSVFRQLVLSHPRMNLQLVLGGTGQERYVKQLLDEVNELGLQGQVIVKRGIDDWTKAQLFSAADIFVSPSDSIQESFGLALVEAMASGLPQIVADWDGYRSTVVHGRTGFLVPTYWGNCDEAYSTSGQVLGWEYDHLALGQSVVVDTVELYKNLSWLAENDDLRQAMSTYSRDRAIREFSYKHTAQCYDDLWTELCHISDGIENAGPARCFDKPTYFEVFGHYASKTFDESWTVYINDECTQFRPHLLRTANRESPWTNGLLNELLLRSLITAARESSGPDGGIEVERLISITIGHADCRGTIKRHILWLLKYGILRI